MPCALVLAFARAGNSSPAKIAITAMTTSSSISVNAFAPRPFLLWKTARIRMTEVIPRLSLFPLKNLPIGQQPLAQFIVIHLLHRHPAIHREARGRRGGLAQNHEHGLHPNRTVSNVGRRKADRHEKVLALARLRHDRAI